MNKAVKITLSDNIIMQISDKIRKGAYAPGSKLPPERIMAEELEVSRNTVREALKALTLIGVIESRQGGGNYISNKINENIMRSSMQFLDLREKEKILDLYEARLVIETRNAFLATKNATPELIALLREDNQKMRECIKKRDTVESSDHDLAFHYRISEASGNFFLNEMLKMVRGPAASLMLKTTFIHDLIMYSVNYHERIIDAMELGNARLASKIMRQHIKRVQETIEINEINEENK
ncbi:MAG: FadR/GntR family transcriptional regulator [Christensenellales bacterium]